jgi:hypothetical protein
MNSKVVARQIEKECIAREPTLKKYLSLVRRMGIFFKGFTVEYIDRNKNAEANELAKVTAIIPLYQQTYSYRPYQMHRQKHSSWSLE